MVSDQRHEMRLEVTHPSGAEEWLCPECGRRFVAQWIPKFRRVILEQGQEQVAHVGHAMNLLAGSVGEDEHASDPGLHDVWKKWVDKLDFGPEDDHGVSNSS